MIKWMQMWNKTKKNFFLIAVCFWRTDFHWSILWVMMKVSNVLVDFLAVHPFIHLSFYESIGKTIHFRSLRVKTFNFHMSLYPFLHHRHLLLLSFHASFVVCASHFFIFFLLFPFFAWIHIVQCAVPHLNWFSI